MLTAILVMTGIAIVLGLTLGYAAIRFKVASVILSLRPPR